MNWAWQVVGWLVDVILFVAVFTATGALLRRRRLHRERAALISRACTGQSAYGPIGDHRRHYDRRGGDTRYLEICPTCARDWINWIREHPQDWPTTPAGDRIPIVLAMPLTPQRLHDDTTGYTTDL